MKPHLGFAPLWYLFVAYRVCAVLLSFSIAFLPQSRAQTESRLHGVVVTADGKPLGGVAVYGSVWKLCCPREQDKAKTNEKGEFVLEHPGVVVHFFKPDMLPLTFVVKTGTTKARIVMNVDKNSLTVPACASADAHHKQIGWGKYGLHFAVPKEGVKILGGEPDVDYVRYVIKRDNSESYLSLWFGPYSMSPDPDDQQFVDSVNFSQRNLTSTKGELIGIDSWGQLSSGLHWRHTGAFASGAIYQNADRDSAALFDQIINSICSIAYPQK